MEAWEKLSLFLELIQDHLCILILKIRNKDILNLREGPTQGLDHSTLTVEAKYPITFTQPRKRFVLTLHYNRSNGFLFVNAAKIYQFKSNDSEIKDYTLCLGNIPKDFIINNLKKQY